MASWNLDKRTLAISENGQLIINNQFPLRFYHFTGYDSGAGANMTEKYNGGNHVVTEIWDWYGRTLQENQQNTFSKYKYFYNNYDNGKPIPNEARHVYRQRKDLQEAFPNPYMTVDESGKQIDGFYSWYTHNG